jgi:hypothetical protein
MLIRQSTLLIQAKGLTVVDGNWTHKNSCSRGE